MAAGRPALMTRWVPGLNAPHMLIACNFPWHSLSMLTFAPVRWASAAWPSQRNEPGRRHVCASEAVRAVGIPLIEQFFSLLSPIITVRSVYTCNIHWSSCVAMLACGRLPSRKSYVRLFRFGYCTSHVQLAKQYCQKTCDLCPAVSTRIPTRNPTLMRRACATVDNSPAMKTLTGEQIRAT